MNTNYVRNDHWLWSPAVPPGRDSQIVTGRAGTDEEESRIKNPLMFLLSHQGPWCHPGKPPGLSAPSQVPQGTVSLLPAGVGCDPIPTKGCSGPTAGLNQRGKSHVNLKNIKMITSSRVTFLFIYRISQLCMTNFAQSHYLEQFV